MVRLGMSSPTDDYPRLCEIREAGVGLTDALAFWSRMVNSPTVPASVLRQELDSIRGSPAGQQFLYDLQNMCYSVLFFDKPRPAAALGELVWLMKQRPFGVGGRMRTARS